jgi:gas vesicle protein GvpN
LNQPALEVAKLAAAAPGPDRPWTGVASGRPFFLDEDIRRIAEKALFYARAGANVHLSGMAGSGKTSLAFHVAEALGRPVSFIAGNNWLTSTDFIGKEIGQSSVSVVDRYVQTVRRTESMSRSEWKDSVLAIAMERGHTLIYDEFTRASPEANSTLLSVLEEGVLAVTDQTCDRAYISAHPCFRVLLTSNPHDYVGVNSAPDAIMDRLLTLDVGAPSSATLAGNRGLAKRNRPAHRAAHCSPRGGSSADDPDRRTRLDAAGDPHRANRRLRPERRPADRRPACRDFGRCPRRSGRQPRDTGDFPAPRKRPLTPQGDTMQRPNTSPMRRPAMMSGLAARTPKEAAIHLVRLEFDRSRIQVGLRQAEQRAELYRAEDASIERRRRALISILTS